MKDGIPATAFESMAIHREVQRLKERGVVFTMEPTVAGDVTLAIFSDTCGNVIQMYQPKT
jgi:predicted enzyme related to lactoylglutathione lyase